MLEALRLENVGPAPKMDMELAPRLNLITGDNGLGKSFLLDVAWWALTRKWPHDLNAHITSGFAARPTERKKAATISFRLRAKAKSVEYESTYVPRDQAWEGKPGRPLLAGLVIYAHADGGFSVWDHARNYWKKTAEVDVQDRLPGYVFSPQEVWDGLYIPIEGKSTRVCNGLLDDWASWIRERGPDAKRMAAVLRLLTASSVDEKGLEPGRTFARLTINDARDIPTVRMNYGQDVPILYASLGVRRITALAYVLSWAWREHLIASAQLGEEPTMRMVLLVDEIESHLHPRWQRSILNSLLHVAKTMHDRTSVQIVAVTHAPLILASAEPFFDAEQDAWFDLDFDGEPPQVHLRKRDFVRLGDVSEWLTSEAFDLKEPRSLESEQAITEALELARNPLPSIAEIERVEEKLRASLGDTDRFWLRWVEFRRTHLDNTTKKGKRK
jgi:hypothetical protein